MPKKDSITDTPRDKMEKRLDKIEALGGAIGTLNWDTPLEGEYLDEIGYMIRDLAIEVKEILSEIPYQAPSPPEGGE